MATSVYTDLEQKEARNQAQSSDKKQTDRDGTESGSAPLGVGGGVEGVGPGAKFHKLHGGRVLTKQRRFEWEEEVGWLVITTSRRGE